MTCVGQDQQPCVGDHRGDIFGMLTLDGLVMITDDDTDWRVDRLELRITPIWLLAPHISDLVDEAVRILRRRRMGSVLPAGALDIGGEGRVLLDAVLYT